MAMNKGCLIGSIVAGVGLLGLACAGSCAGLIWWGFSVTGEMTKGADDFLALLGQGKVQEAYDSAAVGLRSGQTKEAFEAEVKRMGLTEYASSSWPSRNFVNNEATIEGTVTTRAGATIPLKVVLIKEGDSWRVLSLTSPQAGVGGAKNPVPPEPIKTAK